MVRTICVLCLFSVSSSLQGCSQTFTWVGSLDRKVDLLCGLHHRVVKKYLRVWSSPGNFLKIHTNKAKFGDISDFQSLK